MSTGAIVKQSHCVPILVHRHMMESVSILTVLHDMIPVYCEITMTMVFHLHEPTLYKHVLSQKENPEDVLTFACSTKGNYLHQATHLK